jgi:hypothetical protein
MPSKEPMLLVESVEVAEKPVANIPLRIKIFVWLAITSKEPMLLVELVEVVE